jgi:SAM-dependent methyltransferase
VVLFYSGGAKIDRRRVRILMRILRNMFFRKRSHTRTQLEDWLQNLAVEAETVVDVGSKRSPVKDRVASWNVQQYDLLDFPEYDLNQPWDLQEIYHLAFCLEVFEYVYDPMQAMKNLYNLLKSGGELYVSFHFVYPHHSAKKIDYLRYTRWGVDKLLRKAGFTSWERYPRYFKNPRLIDQVYADENMRVTSERLHMEQGYLVKAIK